MSWELEKIDETKDMVFVSAPNGDTQWIEKDLYEKIKRKNEITKTIKYIKEYLSPEG